MMKQMKWLSTAAAVVALGAGALLLIHEPGEDLPRYFRLPEFKLTDAGSREFTQKELEGKVWIANFIFTSCPDICGLLSATMAGFQKEYLNDYRIEFVSFTVDPENDSPEQLMGYGEQFNAQPGKWHFLTGERSDLHQFIVEGMKISLPPSPPFHSDRFVLVDGERYIRGFYSHGSKRAMAQLREDTEIVLARTRDKDENSAH